MKFNVIKIIIRLRIFTLMSAVIAVSSISYADYPRTVIILPFVSDGNSGYSWLAAGIYDYLERAMRGNDRIGVIPLSEVQIITRYLGIRPNTPLPPETISRVVKLSGADEAVSVRYFVAGGYLSISVEIISGTDDTVVRSFSFHEPVERIYQIQDAIFRGIIQDDKPVVAKQKPVKKRVKRRWVTVTPHQSFAPYEWYSRALEMTSNDPQEALSLYVKTLKYDPENAPALVAAASIVHHSQGIIDGALGYLLRADKIYVKRGESNTTKYAFLVVKIADIYDHKSDDDRAQMYLARAFDVWKKRKNIFPDEYASFLSEIGSMYAKNGDQSSAVDYYSMARDLYEKRGKTGTLRYAWIMKNLGECYSELACDAVAEECFLVSGKVFRSLSLDTCDDFAETEFGRGKALSRMGRIDDARGVLDASYKLFVALDMNIRAREALAAMHGMTQPLPKRWRD
jgi:tetratricopeptide (TPR) repeat protein